MHIGLVGANNPTPVARFAVRFLGSGTCNSLTCAKPSPIGPELTRSATNTTPLTPVNWETYSISGNVPAGATGFSIVLTLTRSNPSGSASQARNISLTLGAC